MKMFIENSLANKGIEVSEEHLIILTNEWSVFQKEKSKIKKRDLAEKDMGLRHINVGDSNE